MTQEQTYFLGLVPEVASQEAFSDAVVERLFEHWQLQALFDADQPQPWAMTRHWAIATE